MLQFHNIWLSFLGRLLKSLPWNHHQLCLKIDQPSRSMPVQNSAVCGAIGCSNVCLFLHVHCLCVFVLAWESLCIREAHLLILLCASWSWKSLWCHIIHKYNYNLSSTAARMVCAITRQEATQAIWRLKELKSDVIQLKMEWQRLINFSAEFKKANNTSSIRGMKDAYVGRDPESSVKRNERTATTDREQIWRKGEGIDWCRSKKWWQHQHKAGVGRHHRAPSSSWTAHSSWIWVYPSPSTKCGRDPSLTEWDTPRGKRQKV